MESIPNPSISRGTEISRTTDSPKEKAAALPVHPESSSEDTAISHRQPTGRVLTRDDDTFGELADVEAVFSRIVLGVSSDQKTNPFADTDLVVFSDEHTKPLPLNGIRLSDFNTTITLYNSICIGSAKIKIEDKQPFKGAIEGLIKKLMTREPGRALFRELNERHEVRITETSAHSEALTDEVLINFTDVEHLHFTRTPQGERAPIPTYDYILLAHELIHVLYDHLSQEHTPPTIHKHFTNIIEQEAITGFGNPKEPIAKESESKEEVLLDDKISSPPDWKDLSENRIRAAFGLPYRANHQWISIPDTLVVSSDEVSNDTAEYILESIKYGLSAYIQDFVRANQGRDLTTLTYKEKNFLQTALAKAVAHDQLTIFNQILDLNVDSTFTTLGPDRVQWNMYQLATAYGSGKILKHLLDKGIKNQSFDINTPDGSGNTLMHIVLQKTLLFSKFPVRGDEASPQPDLVQLLLDNSANPSLQNKAGETPLHLALDKVNVVELLLKNGADSTLLDNKGNAPITAAMQDYSLKALQLLLARPHSGFLNARSRTGKTALHALMTNRWTIKNPAIPLNAKIALFADLISAGILPTEKDNAGKTFLDYCPTPELRKQIVAGLGLTE